MSTISKMKNLSAQMGHDKDLKRFVPEEEARICDKRKKDDLKDKLTGIVYFSCR